MAGQPEITLKMLHAFLTWAESATESEAADKLGITQPAVHRKLEKFQTRIGSGPLLMQRGQNNWELTDEGRLILPVIRDLVRRFEQLEAHLSDHTEPPQVLRIATGQFAAQYVLPRAIAVLRQKLPDCRLETYLARGLDRILGVATAQFDLAIVSHTPDQVQLLVRKNLRTRERLLTCERLAQYPFVVVAHRDTPEGRMLDKLPATTRLAAAQLTGWRLIGLDPQSGLRQRLEKLAAPTPLTFAPDTHIGGWPAALAFAEQRLGAALVPLVALPPAPEPRFVTRPFDESFTLDEYLITRPDFSDSTSAVAITVIREAVLATNAGS